MFTLSSTKKYDESESQLPRIVHPMNHCTCPVYRGKDTVDGVYEESVNSRSVMGQMQMKLLNPSEVIRPSRGPAGRDSD